EGEDGRERVRRQPEGDEAGGDAGEAVAEHEAGADAPRRERPVLRPPHEGVGAALGEVVEGARAAGGEARPDEEAEERDPVHVGRRAEEVARRCRHHDEDRDAGLEQLPQVSGTRTGGDGGHQFGFGGEGGGRGPHGRGGLRGWKLNARPPPPTVKRGRVWEREKGRKGEKGRPVAVASLSIFRAPTPPFFLSRPMP